MSVIPSYNASTGVRTEVITSLATATAILPLDVYRFCLLRINPLLVLAQMILCLAFGKHLVVPIPPFSSTKLNRLSRISDVVVLGAVLVQAWLMRSMQSNLNAPRLLDSISTDSVIYFGVISTSHFLTLAMSFTARVRFLCTNARVYSVVDHPIRLHSRPCGAWERCKSS